MYDDAAASKHGGRVGTVSRAKLVVIYDSASRLVPDLYTELADSTPSTGSPGVIHRAFLKQSLSER